MLYLAIVYQKYVSLMKKWIYMFVFIATLGGLQSCLNPVAIAELQENPGKYKGEVVFVTGEVADAFDVPMTAKGDHYVIRDETDEIRVVPQQGLGLPLEGATLVISGKVVEHMKVGDTNIVLLYEEERQAAN